MRKKIMVLAALFSMGLMVSACHDGHPGHDSDRHGGQHDHQEGDHRI